MKRVITPLVILVAASLAHADSQAVSETRSVPAFRGIDLAGVIGVEVSLGKSASVQIIGDADQVGKVITRVKDGTLIVDTPPNFHNHGDHHLRAVVTAPDLASLSLSGTGSLSVTGIANDSLSISLSGTGDIKATGATSTLHASVEGTGALSAKTLIAKDVDIAVSGVGDASVHATQSLNAQLTGTGNISAHGHPHRVNKSVSGLGNIHVE